MTDKEFKNMKTLLRVVSSISSLEVPALLVGVLALIPGFLDETLVGISAVALFSAVALGRHRLVRNRKKYLNAIEEAKMTNNIDKQEYDELIKALNTLTIEGGNNNLAGSDN